MMPKPPKPVKQIRRCRSRELQRSSRNPRGGSGQEPVEQAHGQVQRLRVEAGVRRDLGEPGHCQSPRASIEVLDVAIGGGRRAVEVEVFVVEEEIGGLGAVPLG